MFPYKISNDLEEKFLIKENSAWDKRYWLRIANVCNQKCIFCLDSDNHIGTFNSFENITHEMKLAYEQGATRIIISGGEASIHPQFISIIAFAKQLGFQKIQTITNGRMFVYPSFTKDVIDAGLTEATFSIHGHTAQLHDMLTATKGAFVQAIQGLENILATNQCIINIDICVNKQNYKHIEDIILFFLKYNIYEFDLLHIIPFGNALPYRKFLFYSYQEAEPYLKKAFSYARKDGYYIWTNRFPPSYMEDYEDLIQDPHKFYDEINGRRKLYEDFYLTNKVSCYPNHCPYCFIKKYCRKFHYYIDQIKLPKNIDTIVSNHLDIHFLDFMNHNVNFTKLITIFNYDNVNVVNKYLLNNQYEIYYKNFDLNLLISLNSKHTTYLEIEKIEKEYFDFIEDVSENIYYIILLNHHNNLFIESNIEIILKYKHKLIFKLPFYEKGSTAFKEYTLLFKTLSLIEMNRPVINIPKCLHSNGIDENSNVFNLDIIQDDGKPNLLKLVEDFLVADYKVKKTKCISCNFYETCQGAHINLIRTFGFNMLKPIIN